jgi:ankyrin repeat protein
MANSIGPVKRIVFSQDLYHRFPGQLKSVRDAVDKNDLNEVIFWFRQSNLRYYVLYCLIERKKYVVEDLQICADRFFCRYQMISDIIDLEDFDVNCCDPDGYSLLMVLTGRYSNTKLSQKLLEKGADIHLTSIFGLTFLHHAVETGTADDLTIALLAIEKGADVNWQDDDGETPLYIACKKGHKKWVHTLLYYGADPNIPSHKGIIPLAAISLSISGKKQTRLQDILFPYTFDSDNTTLSLPSMVEAMISQTSAFPRLLQKVSRVSYDTDDLEYFVERIEFQNGKNLKLFVEKFEDVVNDMLDNYQILVILLKMTTSLSGINYVVLNLKGILDAFLESDQGPKLIQASDPSFPAISHLIKTFNYDRHMFVEKEKLTKTAFLMLSYGLCVTQEDLETVYRIYGYCDLFRLLLRMDVQFCDGHKPSPRVLMYYDPSTDLDKCFDDYSSLAIGSLLDHFNHPKLKVLCLSNSNNEIANKAKELPPVPLLVELARNAARKYIARSFQIESPKQFYSVLDRLPIDKLSKRRIALEIKLY